MPGPSLPGQRPSSDPDLRLERVGGDRSSALGPALLAGLIVAFMAVALAKPWGTPGLAPTSSAGASVVPIPTNAQGDGRGEVRPRSGGSPAFIPGPLISPTTSAAIRASLTARPAWGVRAVVEPVDAGSGAVEPMIERWIRVDPDGWGSVPVDASTVRSVGVTAPTGTMVLDVRVVAQVGGREHWVDVEPVPGGPPGASVLLLPPRLDSGWALAWPAGSYRLLVLTTSGVVILGVRLAGSGLLEGAAIDASDRLWLGSPGGRWPQLAPDMGPGLFAGVMPEAVVVGVPGPDPAVLSLGGRSTAALGIGSTWLDTISGQPTAVAAHTISGHLPRAVAIGVVAPGGLDVHDGRLMRLLPGAGGGALSAADRARPVIDLLANEPLREAVRFHEPDGRAWEPGVYAILIEGNGPAGRDVLAYVITLLPGSARQIAAPIAAARAWARFAGQWGVAAGLRDPLDAPGRLAIRYAAQQPESITGGAGDFSRRCLEVNLLDRAQPIVGISHPYSVQPDGVGIQRVFLDGSVELPQPAVARSVIPGLTLVAAAEGSTWAPGWYRLLVRSGGTLVSLPVCVGSVDGSHLAVPATAGQRDGLAGP